MQKPHKLMPKQPILWLILSLTLLLIWLAACSSSPAEVVEVTRIVTQTETVVVESETVEVEVTRVVTETITETVVETVEVEPEPPEATGSEDDSGPLPTEPEDGPKVTTRSGTTNADSVAVMAVNLETAVPRRANPTQSSQIENAATITIANTENTNNWQKTCQLAKEMHKKRCY